MLNSASIHNFAKALSGHLSAKVKNGEAHWVTVKDGPLEGRHLLIDGPRPHDGRQSQGRILAGHGIPSHVVEKLTGATHASNIPHEVSDGPTTNHRRNSDSERASTESRTQRKSTFESDWYHPTHTLRITSKQVGSMKVNGSKIKSAQDVANMFSDLMDADREKAYVVAVGDKGKVIGAQCVHIGSINVSVMHPKDILKLPILSGATGFYVLHNHPSGFSQPSPEDISITKRLGRGADAAGLEFHGHLVLGETYTHLDREGNETTRGTVDRGPSDKKRVQLKIFETSQEQRGVQSVNDRPRVTDPSSVQEFLKKSGLDQGDSSYLLLLDNQNRITGAIPFRPEEYTHRELRSLLARTAVKGNATSTLLALPNDNTYRSMKHIGIKNDADQAGAELLDILVRNEHGGFRSARMTGEHDMFKSLIGVGSMSGIRSFLRKSTSDAQQRRDDQRGIRELLDAERVLKEGSEHEESEIKAEKSKHKKGDSRYMNEDGTFKDGFDGAVKYFESEGYGNESAKKIAGKIAAEKMGKSSSIRNFAKAKKAHRYAYKTNHRDPIFIPVNRIRDPYQTEKALSEDKIRENMRKMKAGEPLDPVMIGYGYRGEDGNRELDGALADCHDGHHRIEAAKRLGYSHVPCVVVGTDPKRVSAAERRYREVWKSRRATDDKSGSRSFLIAMN